ncbi:cotranscriptional regulator FAM172A homolog isoform X2 [Esox lucius]|uniref:Arb2 domain-containing protein n=1 Tax=Esox lucius TaxID=8010 RepID=A0A3P8X968_ESOLU|nr:cotranscriptional regulator FAM172A homolog isoform X2 [Esox lucius]
MEVMVDTAETQDQAVSIESPLVFPYRFTSDGRLRHQVTQEPFVFRFQRGRDPEDTQREDQALCLHITQHVHSILEEQLHLFRLYLPPPPVLQQGDHRANLRPHQGAPCLGYVYLSTRALESPATLVVLVQDRGTVHCGLWSWRAAASEGLEKGSMIPYVRKALEDGCSVLLMNPNQGGVGEMPEDHAQHVWDVIVSRCSSSRVVMVAHGYGGLVFVDLLCRRPQEVVKQVWAVAFLDSSHSLWHQPLDAMGREWLRTHSRRWVLSSKPLNQPVGSLKAGCLQMSAGTQRHEAAPSVCMESVFKFFSKMLSPKPTSAFNIVTRSRSSLGHV